MKTNLGMDEYYEANFIPTAHRIGIATLLLAIVCSMLPALYLSFVKGYFPGVDVLFQVFLVIVAFVGVVWIVEPVSYFPMLGVAGNYMGFLSGNIGNMRLPVAMSCQEAISAESGSKKAEVAAVIGIGVSVFVNLFFVVLLVFAGAAIIHALPDKAVMAIKTYTPASIYAAVFVMFFSNARSNLYRFIALAVSAVFIFIPFDFAHQPYNVAYAGLVAIAVSLVVAKLEGDPQENPATTER
ncbi:MAG: hypothetical protein ACK5NC_11160 [Vibrio sp.]